MKKIYGGEGLLIKSFLTSKTLKVMRISMTLLFLATLQLFAGNSYSQSAKLTLNLQNVSIENILDEIEQQSEFFFVFNYKLVDVDQQVNVQADNKPISEVLASVFYGSDVDYLVLDRQILLSPKSYLKEVKSKVQPITVTGTVSNEDGQPLPGVTVFVKGTANGTICNIDGNYTISNLPADATLLFSFIGMKTQEVVVGNQTAINVTMAADAIGLGEVIAVGYGTMRKRDLTGAVVRVDLEKRANNANISVLQALQGSVPGINIGISDEIGEDPDLSIRGKTSISGSDKPLIVLDGIIFNGRINDLNTNDIKSIDVLKDASAAAVYGSRSANGVILITTKTGKIGKPTISVNVYAGIQDLSPSDGTNIMNGEQFMTRLVDYDYQAQELAAWYRTNPTSASGRPVRPDVTDPTVVAGSARSTEEYDNWAAGNEINWMDEVLRSTAVIQNYDMSVSGRNERSGYYISGSLVDQEGITVGDKFTRATFRTNFDSKITDWLKFGLHSSFAYHDNSGVPTDLGEALQASPWANMYEDDGVSYPIDLAGESYQRHPFSNTIGKHDDTRSNIFLAPKLVFDIKWVDGLKYEINGSYASDTRRNYEFYPAKSLSGTSQNGYARKRHTFDSNWSINNIITYNKIVADIHSFDVTLLASREKRSFSGSDLEGKDFSIPSLGYDGIGLALIQNVSSTHEEENNIAYMGRLNYKLNEKYLVTATLRRDGFSGFAEGNKTALFPSASLGWVMSSENFMEAASWLSYLKLRLSYGTNGNQDVGRYGSIAKAITRFYVYGNETFVGYHPENLGNTDLTWETTTSLNLGFDYSILENKIFGSVDLYNSKTVDVLVERGLPRITGFTEILENIGEIENKGVEFTVNTVNIENGDFRWGSNLAFSINRNKLTKLYGGENDFDIGNGWFTGEPINVHYDFNNLGVVWSEEEFFNGEVPDGFFPGYWKVEDVMTTPGNDMYDAEDDRKILGTPDPNYRISLNNTFTYKSFELTVFLNSIQGGNGYYTGNGAGDVIAGGTDFSRRNNRTAVRPYWRPGAPTTNSPGMYYRQNNTGPLLIDRSFVRLQDVSLAYNLPKSVLNKIGVNNMQFYASSKNLATWTNWAGWDPEVGTSNSPIMRSFILGIKTSF
ncbi:MAG: TonB-dependent receptor [Bacteroidetes bacterium]|nr:TonB-dependent receptor [Bacteroidota bacterium]